MLPAVLAALLLAALAQLGLGAPAGEEACAVDAPPCGEINPRLIMQLPGAGRNTFPMAAGETRTFDGSITYWFDADDEGFSPPDPQQPIVITFSAPRLPDWAKLTVEPAEISVDILACGCFNHSLEDPNAPQLHFEDRVELHVTLEAVAEPQRTLGYEFGKVLVFAKSTESGIYNPGYGIKELRVEAGAPDEGGGLFAPGLGLWSVLSALVLVGLAPARKR